MRKRLTTLLTLIFFLSGIQAQQVTGEYFIPAQNGEIVLKLQQPAPGQVTGTMTDANGLQYTVKATEEAGDVMGTITNAQGGMYFEAYPEGNELSFTLMPPDASIDDGDASLLQQAPGNLLIDQVVFHE